MLKRGDMKKKGVAKQDTLDTFLGGSSSPSRLENTYASRTRRSCRGNASSSTAVEATALQLQEEDGSQSSDAGAIRFEATRTTTDEEDDIKSSPRHPVKKRRLRKRRADSDEEHVSTKSSEEEIGIPVTWNGSNKAIGKRKDAVALNDSGAEEVQPRKRKLVRGQRPPTPEEEEEDLLNEVDENRIIKSRLRTRDKKTAFQKNLERLKRKKRGLSLASSSSSTEDEEVEDVPFARARPGRPDDGDSSQDEVDDADDTFIVEDDNALAPELPAEFSMSTYQDLVHHFKIICQLFVHLAVHEQDERDTVVAELAKNQYFAVPLQITRRKLVGMRDSLVTSSIWRTEYKRSLETYPDFEVHRLDFTVPGCDACHLGSRMSTRLGRLSGLPYDPATFEAFAERDDSDSGDGRDDSDSEGEEGHSHHLKKEFNLGRFCAARTRVFHRFSHWEYALFKTLALEVDELRTGAGAHGFVRVAHARGIQPPEDLSDADGIMDWLDQRGIINIEWQKMNEMMESARNLEMKAKKGEDDDD